MENGYLSLLKTFLWIVALLLVLTLLPLLLDNTSVVEDTYTGNNYESFKAAQIDDFTKTTLFTVREIVKLTKNDKYVKVPVVYAYKSCNTYEDVLYHIDGGYYITLLEKSFDTDSSNGPEAVERNLGEGKPRIIEVNFPDLGLVLIIQCYSNEAYNFYRDINWSKMGVNSVDKPDTIHDYDLHNETDIVSGLNPMLNDKFRLDAIEERLVDPDALSSTFSDLEYYPVKLSNSVVRAIDQHVNTEEDGRNFYNSGDYTIRYFKETGTPDSLLLKYYDKMFKLGNSLLSFRDEETFYLRYEDVTIVIKPITQDECFVYYIS